MLDILPAYSIAIRTLGTAGEKFRLELESLTRQTVQPQRVVVYVADTCGVKYVDHTIGIEEYRYVRKGMVAQRALPYAEITTPYVLLLDDDVELAADTAERLLRAATDRNADCVGADVFRDQSLQPWMKCYAVLTNWVRPHWDHRWAHKITRTADFAYLNNPRGEKGRGEALYPSQKVDGPCALWRKEVISKLRWQDELWMDRLSEFAYGDDWVESYKLHLNGGSLFMLYDAGVRYLNAKTASSAYHHTHKKFYIRSLMTCCIWWRIIYQTTQGAEHRKAVALFLLKLLWLLPMNVLAGLFLLDVRIPYYYLKGIGDAWRFVHSPAYAQTGPYMLDYAI